MSLVRRNILANFGGSLWAGLMGLAFVPLYIRFMGIEAYGLVGLYAGLRGLFVLLDLGLSGTLNRELARLSAKDQGSAAGDMRDLVRTLEIPYWAIGGLIGLGMSALAPLLANHWVHARALPHGSILTALHLMGLCLAFQWPIGFYEGGLMGLQRQVLLNAINTTAATARGLGAVLILWRLSPTVEAYFLWQALITAVQALALLAALWICLPAGASRPAFRWPVFQKVWRFAAGLTAVTIMATILTQLDKVILSRLLSLEALGYYTLAGVVATALYRFVIPVFSATYPRMTREVEAGARESLVILYHKSAQLVSILVLPTALMLALFSREFLLLWTRNPVTVEHTYRLVSLLVIGTAIHCLVHIPYALQLAHGWTRLAFWTNTLSVLLLTPSLVILVRAFGPTGAAVTWLLLNLGYLCVNIPLMHRRLLPEQRWYWYWQDVGRPGGAAAVVVVAGRLLVPRSLSSIATLLTLGLLGLAAFSVAALVAKDVAISSRRPFRRLLITTDD